jgi:hypothetical protein
MNYAKPELNIVASACSAIQGMPKGRGDVDSPELTKSIPAYEADE